MTFPSASSHHPSGVFPYISFHFYILRSPPSCPPLTWLPCLYPSFYIHLHFSCLHLLHVVGVFISACLITTTLAALQTYSRQLFFRTSWAAVRLSNALYLVFLQPFSLLSHALPSVPVSLQPSSSLNPFQRDSPPFN